MKLSQPDYTIHLDENGILHGVVHSDSYVQTLEDMKTDFEFFKEVRRSTRQKIRLIWQPGTGFTQHPEATKFAQSGEVTGMLGCLAVVDESMLTRSVGNALTSIRPLQYPFKMVQNVEEALKFHSTYNCYQISKRRVLVVDDEHFLTEIFAEVIESCDYIPEIASCHKTMKDKLGGPEKPEYIILDYRLRGHLFKDNFKLVRDNAPLSRLIVMTGDVTLDRTKIDAETVWIKPFEMAEQFSRLIKS